MTQAIITCEFVLAPAACEKDEIVDCVLGLIEALRDIKSLFIPPLCEADILNKLIDSDRYPCERIFNRNISGQDDIPFSGKDVARVVGSIIDLGQCLSRTEIFHVSAWQTLSFVPNRFVDDAGRENSLSELLESVAVHNFSGDKEACVLFYANSNGVNSVNVNGELIDTQPLGGLTLPAIVSEDVSFFKFYRDYLCSLNAREIFGGAKSEFDIKFSIYVGALQVLKNSGKNIALLDWDSFWFGDSFVKSLGSFQCHSGQPFSGVFFEVAIHLLAGVPKYDLNPFMMSANSTTQRSRGSFLAWRTHITKSNAALRLMVWKDAHGNIEFANVGSKHELLIL